MKLQRPSKALNVPSSLRNVEHEPDGSGSAGAAHAKEAKHQVTNHTVN